mgnify:CR=1 FL=1
MWQSFRAFVLTHVPYGEKGVILRCLTDAHGQQAYFLPSIRSKKSVVRPAMLLPFTPLHLVARHREREQLERIREARILHHFQSLHIDPLKSATSLYLAELTQQLFSEGQEQKRLWELLFSALCKYDDVDDDIHFPLWLSLRLFAQAGFAIPPRTREEGRFSILQGDWISGDLPDSLTESSSALLDTLLRSSAEDSRSVRSQRIARTELMNGLLIYLQHHVPGSRPLKSVDVLRELLA